MRSLERVRFEDIDLEDVTYCARLDFPEDQIRRLVESIEERGLMNPPHYIRMGKRLIVNAGWCRTFAIKKLGWAEFDAWVSYDITNEEAHLQNLSDNIDREELSILEIANKVRVLKDNGVTVDRIAQKLGKGTQHIYDLLKLTTMPKEIRLAAHEDKISLYHAVEIFKFGESKYLETLAQCIAEGWSVANLKRMRQGGLEQNIIEKRDELINRLMAEAQEKGLELDRDELVRRLSHEERRYDLSDARSVWLSHKGWVVDIPYDWKERQEKKFGTFTAVIVEELEDGSLVIKPRGGE